MMVGQENPVTLVMEWIGCLCAPPCWGRFSLCKSYYVTALRF